MLSDKLPDAANLAIGALFFGQFSSDRPFSTALAISGSGAWLVLTIWATIREKETAMTGIYIMLGTIVLFATVVGIWDLIGERRRRRDLTRR